MLRFRIGARVGEGCTRKGSDWGGIGVSGPEPGPGVALQVSNEGELRSFQFINAVPDGAKACAGPVSEAEAEEANDAGQVSLLGRFCRCGGIGGVGAGHGEGAWGEVFTGKFERVKRFSDRWI